MSRVVLLEECSQLRRDGVASSLVTEKHGRAPPELGLHNAALC